MYTHALGSHDPPLVPLELVLELEELVELVLLEVELVLEVELLVDPLPVPVQVTGCQRAGTAVGVQSGWLVCAWRHW